MKSKIRKIGRVMWQFQWEKTGFQVTSLKGDIHYLWINFGSCVREDMKLYIFVVGPASFSLSILPKI